LNVGTAVSLAATTVAARYLSGNSCTKASVAKALGFDAPELHQCITSVFGSYEEFLRSIIPGMSKTRTCSTCKHIFQAPPDKEDEHCTPCLRMVAKRGVRYLLKKEQPITGPAVMSRAKWRWVVERSEELWGCSYRDFVLREFGVVLPIPKGRVKRRPPSLRIRSVPFKVHPTEELEAKWPTLVTLGKDDKGKNVTAFGGTLELRNRFVEENIPLVWFYARRFINKFQLKKMDLEDVVQAGLEGLMRAVEKFDIRKGYKFSTYAIWWIRQKIQRAYLEENFSCKLPARYNVREDSHHITAVCSLDSVTSLMDAHLTTASNEEGFDTVECWELLCSLGLPELDIEVFYTAAVEGIPLPTLAETYNLGIEEVKLLYCRVVDKLTSTFIRERGLLES